MPSYRVERQDKAAIDANAVRPLFHDSAGTAWSNDQPTHMIVVQDAALTADNVKAIRAAGYHVFGEVAPLPGDGRFGGIVPLAR